MPNFYQILEVSETATTAEIKKAYRTLAKEYHPDMNPAKDAHDKFIQLEEAYSCLSKAHSRRIYDNLLQNRVRSASVNQKYENDLKKRRAEARRRAAHHARMSYQQYQKDEMLKYSGVGVFLKTALLLGTAITLFWLHRQSCFYFFGDVERDWADNENYWPYLIFFSFLFVPILAGTSFFYDMIIEKTIIGKPRGRNGSN